MSYSCGVLELHFQRDSVHLTSAGHCITHSVRWNCGLVVDLSVPVFLRCGPARLNTSLFSWHFYWYQKMKRADPHGDARVSHHEEHPVLSRVCPPGLLERSLHHIIGDMHQQQVYASCTRDGHGEQRTLRDWRGREGDKITFAPTHFVQHGEHKSAAVNVKHRIANGSGDCWKTLGHRARKEKKSSETRKKQVPLDALSQPRKSLKTWFFTAPRRV